MWSQWVWLKSSTATRASSRRSARPRPRIPVPPSRMRRRSPARTSTPLALPPAARNCGDGHAMLPRTPQNRSDRPISKPPEDISRAPGASLPEVPPGVQPVAVLEPAVSHVLPVVHVRDHDVLDAVVGLALGL